MEHTHTHQPAQITNTWIRTYQCPLRMRITRHQAATINAGIALVQETEYYNGHAELMEVLRGVIESTNRHPAGGCRVELETMAAGALGEALAAVLAANLPATERNRAQRIVAKYQTALGERETSENWDFDNAIKAAAAKARERAGDNA